MLNHFNRQLMSLPKGEWTFQQTGLCGFKRRSMSLPGGEEGVSTQIYVALRDYRCPYLVTKRAYQHTRLYSSKQETIDLLIFGDNDIINEQDCMYSSRKLLSFPGNEEDIHQSNHSQTIIA